VDEARTVVLVEGLSDQIAIETLAARRGRRLKAERVAIVPIGGAQAIGRFLTRFRAGSAHVRLAGLCDAGEEPVYRRGLEQAGFGSALARDDMARLGFHVCIQDLEDELIRALGAAAVVSVVEAEGDLVPFRTLQKQPAWRNRSTEAQLHRFMGSGGRRKLRYARLLVEALELPRMPAPLEGVLEAITGRA
jgi:hypothetical protein